MSRFLWCLLVLFFLTESRYSRRRKQQQPKEEGRDFYKILGVSRSATDREIKKAFRKLSNKYHPDKNPDPEVAQKYTDIVAAKETLLDEEKRRVYDQHGESGLDEWTKNQGSGGDPFDMFGSFFGGRNRRRQTDGLPKGPDVHIKLTVSLKTLYLGDVLEFDYKRAVMCHNWDECELDDRECEGPGIRMVTRSLGPGFVQKMQQQDDRCIAHGKRYNPNCSACPDGPTETDSVPLMLEIDPGMKSGDKIEFEEVADETIGHSPGNLIIELVASPHEVFTRQGDDLHLRVNIPLVDALTGFTHDIPHLDGHIVTINPAQIIDCNSVLRVAGEGMPKPGAGRKGDMVIRFNIDFPQKLSEKKKKNLRKILPN